MAGAHVGKRLGGIGRGGEMQLCHDFLTAYRFAM
jgi:hypothetical protein